MPSIFEFENIAWINVKDFSLFVFLLGIKPNIKANRKNCIDLAFKQIAAQLTIVPGAQ